MKKAITVVIVIALFITILTGCNGVIEFETGVYTAENVAMTRNVPGTFIVTDSGYEDEDKIEEFIIDRCVVTVTEGGDENNYNSFYIKDKLCTLNISLIAQEEEQTIIYVGAKYDDDKKIRIGFETKEYYMWIVGEMKNSSGKKYLEATIGYGKSELSYCYVSFIKN